MVERKLFSLVELLIVASVIAILLALLLPALGKARATAQRINCASNMKQLGIGFAQYQADYEDFYPLVGSVGNWTQNGVSDDDWFNMGKVALDRITPYLIPGGKSCSLPWPNNPPRISDLCLPGEYENAASRKKLCGEPLCHRQVEHGADPIPEQPDQTVVAAISLHGREHAYIRLEHGTSEHHSRNSRRRERES